jgi:hypothetical protein
MPMQLAYTARGEAHIHARDRRRDRQVCNCHLACPTAFLYAFEAQRLTGQQFYQ